MKLAELNDLGRFLFAEGVWRADDLTEKSEAALDSATRLECYKSCGRKIVATDAYCMQATAEIGTSNFPNIVGDYPRAESRGWTILVPKTEQQVALVPKTEQGRHEIM